MNILNLKRQVLRSEDGGSDGGGGWGSASYGRSIAGMNAGGVSTGQFGNTSGNQAMGPDGPGFGTAADNAATLAAGAAAGGYGFGGWAAPDTAAPDSKESTSFANFNGAISDKAAGYESVTTESDKALKNAQDGKPSWYNNEDRGWKEKAFDFTNPDPKSKLGRLGIRGMGMSFGDLQNQESVNPGMRETRVAEGMNGVVGLAKTFMPGMGMLNAGITAANVGNDLKNGVSLMDSMTRVIPGVIDGSLNRLTGGMLGKASLVAGAANEFNSSIPKVPSVGAAVWSGLGAKKPSTSLGPGTGNTVSGGVVSPSGTGYDTGGWSSGGSYQANQAPETEIPESKTPATPTPSIAPLDTRLFKKRK